MLNYIQTSFKAIVKNITLFKIIALTVAFTLYFYIIKTLLWTKAVLKFRLISITASYYYFNILGALKGRIIPIWERLVKLVLEENYIFTVENMYSVQETWISIMVIFTTIIMLVFIKHTLSERKHYILLFSLTFILILFSFAFYWDMLIGPVYYPMVTNYWLKTLGLPNLLDFSPVLKDFIHNNLPSYFQEFRRFNGAGYLYVDRAHLENYGWEHTQYPADFIKLHRLEGVNPRFYGYKIRAEMRAFLLPDLITTSKFMENPNLYYNTYRLNKTLSYPFASFKDFNIIHFFKDIYSIFNGNFSMGLSLACIIFVITLILTLLYALNFLTSLSLKDSEKLSPYECGFDPIHSNARIKFDVLYWIIGILYLIFDLEIIFIFPLATILHTLTNPIALFAYLFFMIILTLGFIYEWKKGALKLNIS